MADDLQHRREQVKILLKQANVEIGQSLERVDKMGTHELAEFRGSARTLLAFFDTNGSCAAASKAVAAKPNLAAFFDTNGSCKAGSDVASFKPAAFFDTNGSCKAGSLKAKGG